MARPNGPVTACEKCVPALSPRPLMNSEGSVLQKRNEFGQILTRKGGQISQKLFVELEVVGSHRTEKIWLSTSPDSEPWRGVAAVGRLFGWG